MAMESPGKQGYIFDPESPEELSRLIDADRTTTRGMGGPLAEQSEETIASLRNVLDLACGPGGWVLDVAFAHPGVEVAGVDISTIMINYANARARSQGLTNASFGVMDITKPLDFADGSFDLVNARFVSTVLRRDQWKPFITECTRILRSGGILRLTEIIEFHTTSPAHTRWNALLYQAMRNMGYGFCPPGLPIHVSTVLPRLFRQDGYQNIHHATHTIEYSVGTPDWPDAYHNLQVLGHVSQPVLVGQGLASPDEAQQLTQQMLVEVHADDFCCLQHYMTVWGSKP